jgi:ATP synthase protein I
MTDEPRAPGPPPEREVAEIVGRKARRKLRARREGRRGVWFGLGMFGLVGWAVALPTVAGAAAGLWLDRRFPSRISWTLTLLFAGALLGSLNAWYWVKRESRGE